jgi:hypothetical protein
MFACFTAAAPAHRPVIDLIETYASVPLVPTPVPPADPTPPNPLTPTPPPGPDAPPPEIQDPTPPEAPAPVKEPPVMPTPMALQPSMRLH